MPLDSVGVITVTSGRPRVLRRAMASVRAQDHVGQIEHVIVVDDDPATVEALADVPDHPGLRTTVVPVPRPADERDEPPGDKRRFYPRQARLLNVGVRAASTEWVAFLDDDNEFEPDHLSSLVGTARTHGVDVAHSGRTMWHTDGSPYLEETWHTVSDPAEAARIFGVMCDKGVRVRGTNLLLDRADPLPPGAEFRTSSVIRAQDPVTLVDQNVWLVRRDLLLKLPVPETFTEAEHQANTAPDDKILQTLLANSVRIVRTGRPTVRYYLGGISNRHLGETSDRHPV